MSKPTFEIDYRAARGSNTGDEYHELWAVRQALRLLSTDLSLSAVTVEGLSVQDEGGSVWDGVDCGLFFNGETVAEAERIEILQLKYSSSNPTASWTVARLATGSNSSGKTATSPIRRLADAYKGLIKVRSGKPLDSIGVALVTNQPVDPKLLTLVEEARKGVPAAYKRAWQSGDPDLHRLVHASSLTPKQFQDFANVLDLQSASGSRFAVEDEMLKTISLWADAEFRETANRLREYVRKRMLPEAAGELITREKVLIQFGVSDEYALFPCPSAVTRATAPVPRSAARRVVELMATGKQHLCLHGGGGVGKTTTLREIEASLPAGSLMITFDCYGAGSYLDASALRHRVADAFIQLSNDLARCLRLPLMLEPQATRDYPRAFRQRLEVAAQALAAAYPEARLVVAIDAADNSVTAAQTRSPAERSFVHDLMSFKNLPDNVNLLVSSRTGRLDELQLPSIFEKVLLAPFDRIETKTYVAQFWLAPEDWIDDFHHLSGEFPEFKPMLSITPGLYLDMLSTCCVRPENHLIRSSANGLSSRSKRTGVKPISIGSVQG